MIINSDLFMKISNWVKLVEKKERCYIIFISTTSKTTNISVRLTLPVVLRIKIASLGQ